MLRKPGKIKNKNKFIRKPVSIGEFFVGVV